MYIKEKIETELEKEEGKVIAACDWLDMYGQKIITNTLSALKRQGVIERLVRGIYYRPKKSILGKVPPSKFEVIKKKNESLLYKKKINIDRLVQVGEQSWYNLGLTTQVSTQYTFLGCCDFKYQNYEVKKADWSKLKSASDDAIKVVDALKNLNKIKEEPLDNIISRLANYVIQNEINISTVEEVLNITNLNKSIKKRLSALKQKINEEKSGRKS